MRCGSFSVCVSQILRRLFLRLRACAVGVAASAAPLEAWSGAAPVQGSLVVKATVTRRALAVGAAAARRTEAPVGRRALPLGPYGRRRAVAQGGAERPTIGWGAKVGTATWQTIGRAPASLGRSSRRFGPPGIPSGGGRNNTSPAMPRPPTRAAASSSAAATRFRCTQLCTPARGPARGPGRRAAIDWSSRNRRRSAASSPQSAYRSRGSAAIALRMIVSRRSGSRALSCRGRGGRCSLILCSTSLGVVGVERRAERDQLVERQSQCVQVREAAGLAAQLLGRHVA